MGLRPLYKNYVPNYFLKNEPPILPVRWYPQKFWSTWINRSLEISLIIFLRHIYIYLKSYILKYINLVTLLFSSPTFQEIILFSSSWSTSILMCLLLLELLFKLFLWHDCEEALGQGRDREESARCSPNKRGFKREENWLEKLSICKRGSQFTFSPDWGMPNWFSK